MLAAVLGWLGTAGTFMAYAMLWRGRVTSDSLRYAALNALGGLMGGIACAIYGAWPSVAANFAWAALGLHSMVGTLRRRRAVPAALPVPAA
jgi:ammonia channel protein AmtB